MTERCSQQPVTTSTSPPGMITDGFRPDRFDVAGALACLGGVGITMYTRRQRSSVDVDLGHRQGIDEST